MAEQPSLRALTVSSFFEDGAASRHLIDGTIARGHLRLDHELYTGRKQPTATGPYVPLALQAPKEPEPATPDQLANIFVDEFPFAITEDVLEHGHQRFMIYCIVCHDALGTGNGKIVERGFTHPPSYHIDRLRAAPVGYLFAVATEGYGSMPSYEAQIPTHDRWAIIAYVRALQLSQHFPRDAMTDAMRQEFASHEQPKEAP
jgi:mono/diheme cytochrome c family protein